MDNRLGDIETFLMVASEGSFANAAKALRLTPSAVSRSIARLEQRLGVTLLRRTTRALALTRARCAPGSLDGELARGWELVRAYALRGGRLVLSPAAEVGAEVPMASEWERDPDAGAPRR